MNESRITSIHYSGAPARKRPRAGDTRVIGDVEHIRQQRVVDDPLHGRCHLVSNGRPVWEWVAKGGPQDGVQAEPGALPLPAPHYTGLTNDHGDICAPLLNNQPPRDRPMNNASQQHYFKPEWNNEYHCAQCGEYITADKHVRAPPDSAGRPYS